MNIVEQAASIAASADEQLNQMERADCSYEHAVLEAFYQVRGQEMREKKESKSWTSKNCATGKNKQGWMKRLIQRLIQSMT